MASLRFHHYRALLGRLFRRQSIARILASSVSIALAASTAFAEGGSACRPDTDTFSSVIRFIGTGAAAVHGGSAESCKAPALKGYELADPDFCSSNREAVLRYFRDCSDGKLGAPDSLEMRLLRRQQLIDAFSREIYVLRRAPKDHRFERRWAEFRRKWIARSAAPEIREIDNSPLLNARATAAAPASRGQLRSLVSRIDDQKELAAQAAAAGYRPSLEVLKAALYLKAAESDGGRADFERSAREGGGSWRALRRQHEGIVYSAIPELSAGAGRLLRAGELAARTLLDTRWEAVMRSLHSPSEERLNDLEPSLARWQLGLLDLLVEEASHAKLESHPAWERELKWLDARFAAAGDELVALQDRKIRESGERWGASQDVDVIAAAIGSLADQGSPLARRLQALYCLRQATQERAEKAQTVIDGAGTVLMVVQMGAFALEKSLARLSAKSLLKTGRSGWMTAMPAINKASNRAFQTLMIQEILAESQKAKRTRQAFKEGRADYETMAESAEAARKTLLMNGFFVAAPVLHKGKEVARKSVRTALKTGERARAARSAQVRDLLGAGAKGATALGLATVGRELLTIREGGTAAAPGPLADRDERNYAGNTPVR